MCIIWGKRVHHFESNANVAVLRLEVGLPSNARATNNSATNTPNQKDNNVVGATPTDFRDSTARRKKSFFEAMRHETPSVFSVVS